jgi:hypothetical protein
MASLSISDYVEAALDAIEPGSLRFWTSYRPHLDKVTLTEVLIDLDFSREGLQALISRIHGMREAGDSLFKVRLQAAEEVQSWITSPSINNVSQNSVGVALLKDASSIAFLSTGPQESTWKFLARDSQYYPLVALSDELGEQVRKVLDTKLGETFKETKDSYSTSGQLCRNLLHVWRLMLDYWLHLKAEQDPGVAGNVCNCCSPIFLKTPQGIGKDRASKQKPMILWVWWRTTGLLQQYQPAISPIESVPGLLTLVKSRLPRPRRKGPSGNQVRR